MAGELERSKAGQFTDMILDALGTPASFQGKNIRQEDFAGLLHEIVTSLSARLPAIQKATISSFADLSEFLASCVPPVPDDSATCPVLRLSPRAEDLLEAMGLRYKPIDEFFHGAGWGGVRIGDFTAKLFADASIKGKKQALEVFTLVRELLREQGLCVLTDQEKANPDLPSCGLYSKITLHNFYEILRSAGAELLVVHNNNQAFGVSLYHNKGTCAEEDKEFLGRAHQALEQNSQKIVAHFGEAFDPKSCATAFGVFISPNIRKSETDGGGDTSRSLAYDAFVYHMLRELAHTADHPKWVLGWVRSYPNPNTAEAAHEKRCFYDTGIELPYDDSGTMRLKLLLINLDQIPLHGERGDVARAIRSDTPYAKEMLPNFERMRASAYKLRFTNWDHD